MKKVYILIIFFILFGNTEVSYGCKKCWHSLCCGCLCDSSCSSYDDLEKPHDPRSVLGTPEDEVAFISDKDIATVSTLVGYKFRQLVFAGPKRYVGIEDQESFWLSTPNTLRPLILEKHEKLNSFFRSMRERDAFDIETLQFLFTTRSEEYYQGARLSVRDSAVTTGLVLCDMNKIHNIIGASRDTTTKTYDLDKYVNEKHRLIHDAVVPAATEHSGRMADDGVAKQKAFDIISIFLVLCNRLRTYTITTDSTQLRGVVKVVKMDENFIYIYLSVFFVLDERTVYEGGMLVDLNPKNVVCYLVRPVSGSYAGIPAKWLKETLLPRSL